MTENQVSNPGISRHLPPYAGPRMQLCKTFGWILADSKMNHQHIDVSDEVDECFVRAILIATKSDARVTHIYPISNGWDIAMRHPHPPDTDISVAPDYSGFPAGDIHCEGN